jgi:hypothetical protein
MPRIELDMPDALWQRMQNAPGEDWGAIAVKAIEAHLALRKHESYASGYSWARDRADIRDLKAMVESTTTASATDIVRGTRGFSQRDEFGDHLAPSDEMWEAFVDGATQLYRDVSGR